MSYFTFMNPNLNETEYTSDNLNGLRNIPMLCAPIVKRACSNKRCYQVFKIAIMTLATACTFLQGAESLANNAPCKLTKSIVYIGISGLALHLISIGDSAYWIKNGSPGKDRTCQAVNIAYSGTLIATSITFFVVMSTC